MPFVDLTGKTFGKMTVIAQASSRNEHTYWVVRCPCGTEMVRDAYNIKTLKSGCRSCPARQRAPRDLALEQAKRLRKSASRFRLTDIPEFQIWRGMLRRCHSDRASARELKYYMWRGISVCDRWRYSFQNFLSDMGPRPSPKHSIDRIDNDGNYEPSNCRWATALQQAQNRRPHASTYLLDANR